jgi:endonuclease G
MYKAIFLSIALIFINLASSADEFPIYSKHFVDEMPKVETRKGALVIRDLYAYRNNNITKFPDWVAYRLTSAEVVGVLDLERKWRNSPFLKPSNTLEGKSKSKDDYRKNGNYDRGHMVPLASVKGSRVGSTVNCYSVIMPQRGPLNQGPWRNLENHVRTIVKSGQIVWVIAGPLYESPQEKLSNADEPHIVPSGFFMVVCQKTSGEIHARAFIMLQNVEGTTDFKSFVKPIANVETRAKIKLFSDNTTIKDLGAFGQ